MIARQDVEAAAAEAETARADYEQKLSTFSVGPFGPDVAAILSQAGARAEHARGRALRLAGDFERQEAALAAHAAATKAHAADVKALGGRLQASSDEALESIRALERAAVAALLAVQAHNDGVAEAATLLDAWGFATPADTRPGPIAVVGSTVHLDGSQWSPVAGGGRRIVERVTASAVRSVSGFSHAIERLLIDDHTADGLSEHVRPLPAAVPATAAPQLPGQAERAPAVLRSSYRDDAKRWPDRVAGYVPARPVSADERAEAGERARRAMATLDQADELAKPR